MAPSGGVEDRTLEILLARHILREVGAHETTDSVNDDRRFSRVLLPGLAINQSASPEFGRIIPLGVLDKSVQDSMLVEGVLLPDTFPVRAKLGLLHEILRPVRVEFRR